MSFKAFRSVRGEVSTNYEQPGPGDQEPPTRQADLVLVVNVGVLFPGVVIERWLLVIAVSEDWRGRFAVGRLGFL